MPDISYLDLHADALVIDGTCPLLLKRDYIDWYIEGGVDIVTPTVGSYSSADDSLKMVSSWLERIRERDDLVLVTSGDGARAAKAAGQTGLVFHFQGAGPIGDDLRLVDAFKQLGVGIMQLCYNTENNVGFGAQVDDGGLKSFGRDFIERCNAARVIVDCAHTGHRTSMETIEASEAPVIVSHANPFAMHRTQSERNVNDELIEAIAETGGIIGITGFPGFLVHEGQPTMEQFVSHIDHVVSVAGIDHVGLGIDYYLGQHPVLKDGAAETAYRREVDAGRWTGTDYPPPPHKYPLGIETPKDLPNLTKALLEHGYSEEDTRKILGLNWVSVYDRVWL